ncbi:MAG: LCP family protein [Patescibacteria group bacterium]
MAEYRINLIDGIKPIETKPETETQVSRIEYQKPKISLGRLFFRLVIVVLVIVVFFSVNTIIPSQGIISNLGRLSFWQSLVHLASGKDKILKGELTDRTNILILGIGGAEHEGPYLTDTIILASLKPSTKELALFSIPRDLYVPTADFGWQKINNINSLGTVRMNDGGALTSQTISEIFELPVHYWLRVDFSAFKKFIDWLGGVEIDVERSFVDYQYPAPNFRFQTISFKAGRQIMDGERALQFVRSRHGTNNESTDFARTKRQQKLILAVAEKMKKENLITPPLKIWEIYNIFHDKISTNLDFSETVRLAKIFANLNLKQVKTYTFEAGPEGLLYSETALNGAYILKPKSGNFKEMAEIIKNAFSAKNSIFGQKQIANHSPAIQSEVKPKLIILNGTLITGLAQKTKNKLESLGYQVSKIGNAPTRNYQKTIIYSVKEIDPKAAESLKKELKTEIVTLPENLKYLITPETDFLIILGTK